MIYLFIMENPFFINVSSLPLKKTLGNVHGDLMCILTNRSISSLFVYFTYL